MDIMCFLMQQIRVKGVYKHKFLKCQSYKAKKNGLQSLCKQRDEGRFRFFVYSCIVFLLEAFIFYNYMADGIIVNISFVQQKQIFCLKKQPFALTEPYTNLYNCLAYKFNKYNGNYTLTVHLNKISHGLVLLYEQC